MSDEHVDPEYADDELEDIALNNAEVLEESDVPVVGGVDPQDVPDDDLS